MNDTFETYFNASNNFKKLEYIIDVITDEKNI
jgi:hypothetical protein